MKDKFEYVRSLRLAGFCMLNGFRLLRIEQNKINKNKDVYVFKQSEELSECILKYISTKEKKYGNNSKSNGKDGRSCK